MAVLNISIALPDDYFHNLLHSLAPFDLKMEPPGLNLYRIADQLKPSSIFATGSIRDTKPSAMMSDGWDTFYLARWVKENPDCNFTTVELDPESVRLCKQFLYTHGLGRCVRLICGDSLATMRLLTKPVDMFVLDSCDGLEHGLAEFQEALKHNPKIITMDDWDKKVLKAAEYAASVGIPFEQIDRYTVFKIPHQG